MLSPNPIDTDRTDYRINGIVYKNIRPHTNNDALNIQEGAQRRAKPLKHYRKGYASTYEAWRTPVSDKGMPNLITTLQEIPGTHSSVGVECSKGNRVITSIPKINDTCCVDGASSSQRSANQSVSARSPYKNTTAQYLQSRCTTYDQKVFRLNIHIVFRIRFR